MVDSVEHFIPCGEVSFYPFHLLRKQNLHELRQWLEFLPKKGDAESRLRANALWLLLVLDDQYANRKYREL